MATAPAPRPHRNRFRPYLWGTAIALLLLPAIAMRFTDEVRWDAFDFVVMGTMLAVACGLYELGARLSGSPAYRAAFGSAVVAAFLTVWVNGAVGMFGSEDDLINVIVGGVLLVAASGSLVARFRVPAMARAMGATAGAQLLAAAIGLAVGLSAGTDGPGGPRVSYDAVLTACFALPWLASAMLFRKAAHDAAGDRAAS